MSYAIVGFGKIGQALAHAFARRNINVTVAGRRPPEALAPQAQADWTYGRRQVAARVRSLCRTQRHPGGSVRGASRAGAKALPSWKGKTGIDANELVSSPT